MLYKFQAIQPDEQYRKMDSRLAKASQIKAEKPILSLVACLMLAGFSPLEASKQTIRTRIRKKRKPSKKIKGDENNDKSRQSDSPRKRKKRKIVCDVVKSDAKIDVCSVKIDVVSEERSLNAKLTDSVEKQPSSINIQNTSYCESSGRNNQYSTPHYFESFNEHNHHTRELFLGNAKGISVEESSRSSFSCNDREMSMFTQPDILGQCESVSSDVIRICSNEHTSYRGVSGRIDQNFTSRNFESCNEHNHQTRESLFLHNATQVSEEEEIFSCNNHGISMFEQTDEHTSCCGVSGRKDQSFASRNFESCNEHNRQTRESLFLDNATQISEESSSRSSFSSNNQGISMFEQPDHHDQRDSVSFDATRLCSAESTFNNKTLRKQQPSKYSPFSNHHMPPDVMNQVVLSAQHEWCNVKLQGSDDISVTKESVHDLPDKHISYHKCRYTDTENTFVSNEYSPPEDISHLSKGHKSFSIFLDEMLKEIDQTFDP
mmetsp:Transcript_16658/g.37449  ORF Transcript_16658/g.37449 Transcript_16658/m.37449 type:complete len:489 (-) Transcript_16658:77-1543(-)